MAFEYRTESLHYFLRQKISEIHPDRNLTFVAVTPKQCRGTFSGQRSFPYFHIPTSALLALLDARHSRLQIPRRPNPMDGQVEHDPAHVDTRHNVLLPHEQF